MLKRNLVANYLGQGWVAFMGLAFIPLYIKYLGIESYGLIGIFTVLQAWLVLLDMGMTPALGREMARLTGGVHSVQSIRNLLRSVEIIILGMASVIGFGIWAASNWLASNWLKTENLTTETVAHAFIVMGVIIAFRLVEGVYRSSIMGLQKQVLFNVLNSVMATFRSIGAVVTLIWISPTIEAFFIWQGIVSIFTLLVLMRATYRILPESNQRGHFSLNALSCIWRFASGMMGITLLSLLLMQADKVVLSKLLTLSDYGYYMLASAVAGVLFMASNPIVQAWYPRLVELHAKQEQLGFIEAYHQGAQLVSVIIGSAVVVLFVFAEQILYIWTQNLNVAQHTSTLVSLLAFGNFFNILMFIPYQAQLANGWTNLAIRINIIAVLFIVPAVLWLAPLYGAEGAAWAWVSLNVGYVAIGVHFMYQKILQKEKYNWYKNDIVYPFGAAMISGTIIGKLIPIERFSLLCQFCSISVASFSVLLIAGFAAPLIRKKISNQISYWINFLIFKKT